MPLSAGVPIVDHHCHLSPRGEGVDAVRRFRAAGGTHLFVATQSYDPEPPADLDGYARQFETTEALAKQAREATGVSIRIVVAPFPVDLVRQVPRLGGPGAEGLHRSALDLAGRWVRERRAVALGEVGWPHFEVDAEVASVAERVVGHAADVAHDVGCPIVVHSADLVDAAGYATLEALARAHGLPAARVVKHFARTSVAAGDRRGVPASYVATRPLVEAALPQEAPWFLETDFLDDPRRPGAVLDLATIPRRAAWISARGSESERRLRIPFVDSIEASYGFTPTLEEATEP